ncbi:hypothetical protein HGI30_02175 [Paenibacillus albicereus]|uniref:Uncharacterized protein n=1 Tax=Paenibacillus albicereus TaxID=2726185 RepID=A0A6H2GSW5_9BACL|nr:hypothetical protein [Paenibacillus albicereus]QJC50514.1 hypothetical protein HGI30_02175 [Paenibacillus albicereus]
MNKGGWTSEEEEAAGRFREPSESSPASGRVSGSAIVTYLLLYLVFIALFMGAALGVERIEGYKIATTEYYGLMNLGGIFVAMVLLLAVVLYPVVLLPITLAVNRWLRHPLLQIALFLGLFLWAGQLHYRDYPLYFREGYGLSPWTSWWMFGLAGLLYAGANLLLTSLGRSGRPSSHRLPPDRLS